MSMTVKKLIKELEQIENKFLEVQFLCTLGTYELVDIERVSRQNNKVILFSNGEKQNNYY